MSLYKIGISDKTMGAMQNADPEVQKMMLESQQNNTQPDSGGGILDIIKELFGFGSAEASDLGAIANNEMLQSILNPKTPKIATTFLESMNRGPIVDDNPYPPEFFPNDQQGSLNVDMNAMKEFYKNKFGVDNTGIMSSSKTVPFGTPIDIAQGS